MSFTSSYVMAGIGTFFILFWLFLYIKYRNAYDQVIDAIDKKKFMFGEIYFIGFGFITLFHINIKTERGSKKIKEISEIYGRKYAEFYHYVITGGSISYFLTLLPMGFCLGAIANNVMLGVLGVVASALLLEYMSGEIKKNVNERRVASIVSKSMAVTGYEKVGKHTADNVNFDFKDNKYFTQDSVNTIYDEKAKLYRYFYPDPIAGNSDIESINSSLTSLIDNLSIISGGGVTCDINAKNYFINQTVSVTIKREGAIPEVFSYIGMDGVSSDITVTATAASCDGAEFVRNTDMVYDFVTFLSDRLHISDKISYLKEKVQGVFQEDAKEAANAAG